MEFDNGFVKNAFLMSYFCAHLPLIMYFVTFISFGVFIFDKKLGIVTNNWFP